MEESDEKIAVVAVHGVAYHAPGQSAREVSNLLATLRMSDKDSLCYTPFTEHSLRLPVREIDPELTQEETHQQGEAADPGETADIGFTRELLQDYHASGKEAVYETVCIKGHRVLKGEKNQAIDVYELYWNDLSRISTNFFGVFSSFYLLLFHLCDIGRQSIRFAGGVSKWLDHIGKAHWLITFGLPSINLVLITVLLGMVPLSYSGIISKILLVSFISFVPLVVFYLKAKKDILIKVKKSSISEEAKKGKVRADSRRNVVIFGVLALTLALVFGIVGSLFLWGTSEFVRPVSLIGGTVVGGSIAFLGLYLIGERFVRERGVALTQIKSLIGVSVVGLASSVVYCCLKIDGRIEDRISTGFLTFLLIGAGILFFIWVIQFIISFYATFVIGRNDFNSNTDPLLCKRAIDTLRITTWAPMVLFLYLALTIWIGIAGASLGLFQGLCVYPNANRVIGFVYHWIHSGSDTAPSVVMFVSSFITDCIKYMIGKLYWYGVIALLSCAIPALWAFGPSILDELKPPRHRADVEKTEQEKQVEDICCQGNWLNGGFKTLGVAGVLLGISIVCYVLGLWLGPLSSGSTFLTGSTVPTAIGAGGLASIGVVLALLNRFNKTFSTLGSIVGVAVDVDNHLKERPYGRTPRAKMAARGASLLRYLEREGYSRVVIVAHSQGTVLMADLLRFLVDRKEVLEKTEPALHQMLTDTATDKKCELSFMTMGSPLRQLYYLRFPHLYGWVENPDPTKLGVTEWVNFYRAGDYVGRGVWRDNDSNTWTYGFDAITKGYSAREFCMGRGAHTHYWDDTAPEVAHTLDLLITRGRRPESATQTLEKMVGRGDVSPEEQQRLKNLGILETEIRGLFPTEPGLTSAPELPERLNSAAQKVHELVGQLDDAVGELGKLVQERKATEPASSEALP